MGYQVFVEKSAQKELSNIPKNDQDRIIQAIRALSENPRPPHVKKLSGREAWRIRIGKYRIIYEIDDNKLIILTRCSTFLSYPRKWISKRRDSRFPLTRE